MAVLIVLLLYPLLVNRSLTRLMLRLRASSLLESRMARLVWECSTALLVFHGCAESACRMIPADVGLMYSSVVYFPLGSTVISVSRNGIESLFSVVSMVKRTYEQERLHGESERYNSKL